jgi:hypothetical protein
MFIGISDHKEMLQKIYPVFVNTVLRHSAIYDNFNVILEGLLERNPEKLLPVFIVILSFMATSTSF